jgi:methyl-accepting chemotaxis protein
MGSDNWKSAEVPDHHSCRLGKWYDGIRDETIRNHPAFKALIGPHERVHSIARKALEAAAAENTSAMIEALRMLDEAGAEVERGLDGLAALLSESEKRAVRAA